MRLRWTWAVTRAGAEAGAKDRSGSGTEGEAGSATGSDTGAGVGGLGW